jgi:hypothetical protein
MPRLRNIGLARSLLTCAACSTKCEVTSAPSPPAYQGIPAGLISRCTVNDVDMVTAS